jgi:hypothetical protein
VAAASQPVQIEDRQARRACASRMLPALLMTQHAAGRGVDLVFNAARLYLCALIAQITHDAKRGLTLGPENKCSTVFSLGVC